MKNREELTNIRYGVWFNTYENEIYVYKIYCDGSKTKIIKFYEKENYIHLDIATNNLSSAVSFIKSKKIAEWDMIGANMTIVYCRLISADVQPVTE